MKIKSSHSLYHLAPSRHERTKQVTDGGMSPYLARLRCWRAPAAASQVWCTSAVSIPRVLFVFSQTVHFSPFYEETNSSARNIRCSLNDRRRPNNSEVEAVPYSCFPGTWDDGWGKTAKMGKEKKRRQVKGVPGLVSKHLSSQLCNVERNATAL